MSENPPDLPFRNVGRGDAVTVDKPDLVIDENNIVSDKQPAVRQKWGNDLEFLFSCIALSVGFGNLWRFPFIALENGGGAFLFPYLIVLFLIGRPIYYLEMVMGQFGSRGSIKVYDLSPIMRGIGYGQTLSITVLMTFYSALMALTIRYMILSFMSPLPWSFCDPAWGPDCVNSSFVGSLNKSEIGGNTRTSSEFFFLKNILKEASSIDDGIGTPDWKLVLCLAFCWICIAGLLIKGIQSSGKASYFLAIFPYVIILILLVRSCLLEGAGKGILYFITPQWGKLLEAKVWYEAVTQVFFSLSICFGNVIVYASHNRFEHNIYRDAMIVSILDTITSIISGCITFGVIGHLAFVTETEDITEVVKGGPGLTFITYPDAIAKFSFLPNVFAVLFFLMLFILGIGSNVGMVSALVSGIRENFPKLHISFVTICVCIGAFGVGIVYVTPGGFFILDLLDFYGVTFIGLTLAGFELLAFGWIYGVDRICRDIKFMLNRSTGFFWRICWGFVTPVMIFFIFIYFVVTFENITYNGYVYPDYAYAIGWCVYAFGAIQLPAWALYAIWKQYGYSFTDKLKGSFKPFSSWGPEDPKTFQNYQESIVDYNFQLKEEKNIFKIILARIFK